MPTNRNSGKPKNIMLPAPNNVLIFTAENKNYIILTLPDFEALAEGKKKLKCGSIDMVIKTKADKKRDAAFRKAFGK